MARPVVWTPEKKEAAFSRILADLSQSELGLDHICAADKALPNPSTVYEWLNDDEKFAERHARASFKPSTAPIMQRP